MIEKQIERAIEVFRCKNQRRLANSLGISETDFSNRKGRGTLIKLIESEAYRRSLDVNYILHGIRSTEKAEEIREPYGIASKEDEFTKHALNLTEHVMKSQHREIGKALMKNLEEFAEAVNTKDELERCKVKLEVQDEKILEMAKKINEQDRDIKHLKKQVKELLRREPHCGSVTPGDTVPVPEEKAM